MKLFESQHSETTTFGVITDKLMTVMSPTTETLAPENEESSFVDHRETIFLTAKNLIEDTENLVVAAQGAHKQLARSANNAHCSMTNLVDSVRLGAHALKPEDNEVQLMLLTSAKDVAAALTELFAITKSVLGNPKNDLIIENLKMSAKTMVAKVSSLLRTVHAVEEETSRCVQAIETTVQAVKQAVSGFETEFPKQNASPDDLIRSTKGVILATSKAVAAGKSGRQEDISLAANIGQRYCTELLTFVNAVASNADMEYIKNAIFQKGQEIAEAYCELLEYIVSVVGSPPQQKNDLLKALSTKVALPIGDLVELAEQVKDIHLIYLEHPEILSNNEFSGVSASVESSATILAELKSHSMIKDTDMSLCFGDQILKNADAITAAACDVLRAATAAQKELEATEQAPLTTGGNENGQWSRGFISAARLVAAATESLCEAAYAEVKGDTNEEKLIASAKVVSNSTTQLLLACRVKTDIRSKTQKDLQLAGAAVKRTSEELVKIVKGSLPSQDEEIDLRFSTRAGNFRDELEVREMILRKERELERARANLIHIRKSRYQSQLGSSG